MAKQPVPEPRANDTPPPEFPPLVPVAPTKLAAKDPDVPTPPTPLNELPDPHPPVLKQNVQQADWMPATPPGTPYFPLPPEEIPPPPSRTPFGWRPQKK